MTKNYFSKPNLFMGISIVFFVSLYYSKFLLSVSIFAFVFLAMANVFKGSALKTLVQLFKNFRKLTSFWAISLIFMGVILSGINSSELSEWGKHLQLKLPFLVLPLAFASLDMVDTKKMHCLLYAFVVVSFLTAIQVMFLYGMDMEFYHERIKIGQSLPTPLHHVSYSLFMAFASVAGIILYLEDRYFPKWRIPIAIIAAIIFLFMHVLAVRSGLATMYLAFLILVIYRMWRSRNYLQGLGCLLLFALAPILAYYFLPSFFYKIGYVVWDITQMLQSKTINYSDGGRLLSYQLGLDLFSDNLIFGTGLGDFKTMCESWYIQNVNEYQGKLNYPHNQFLFNLASTGLFGFIMYQLAIWIPFVKAKLYKNYFSLTLYVIIITSFLVETQLERSAGICFFLFFVCLALANKSLKQI